MEEVVPGILQRLRAADIIRMVGLTTASLGQHYCHAATVHTTTRQGACISGVVDLPYTTTGRTRSQLSEPEDVSQHMTRHYPVEVELQSATAWLSICPCSSMTSTLCPHAAALLYQWLAHPGSFVASTSVPSAPHIVETMSKQPSYAATLPAEVVQAFTKPASVIGQQGPLPLPDLLDMLIQVGLNELRAMAREYEMTPNGMNKQQLAEALLHVLQQPEAVRRVATTLEKPQRQLLAAITLAGGAIPDADLPGLFERFRLGKPNQLQPMLIALQKKALLVRTSFNSTVQQRLSLKADLLAMGWYVPMEVRTALPVTIPLTVWKRPEHTDTDKTSVVTVRAGEPSRLLADLLLVVRTLDGYHLTHEDQWQEHAANARSLDTFAFSRSSSIFSANGSVPLPPPGDMLSHSLLTLLQSAITRSPAFLRFAVRLLRLAGLVQQDDRGTGTRCLHALPHAAQVLLGPASSEVARNLFQLWLAHSSHQELFDLQEDGLRLRCHATSLNFPLLHSDELGAENSEARKSLIALLAQVPLDQWVSFPAFVRFIYRLNPSFLQKRQELFSSPHWWLEDEAGHILRPLHFTDWLRAEGDYLTRLFCGPLHWWGMCDIACSQDERVQAFRLTPLAAWFFHGIQGGTYAATHEEDNNTPLANSFAIEDTTEILVAPCSMNWPIIEVLENFAEGVGVRHDRLYYRLTPKSLGEAISRGQFPTLLLDLLHQALTQASQPPEPLQHLLTQLERWIASYGRVRLYTGAVMVETLDSKVMRELSATTSLDAHTVQTIHPTLRLLNKPGVEHILDDLKGRGQSPLLHDEDIYGTA